jgi:hypothetical protein
MTDAQQTVLKQLEQYFEAERRLPMPPHIEVEGNLVLYHGETEIMIATDGKMTLPHLGAIDDNLPLDLQEQIRKIEAASKTTKDPTELDLFAAVTPLYAFSSDLDELSIDNSFRLVRYDPDSPPLLVADDILFRHLQVYTPDYLLWQRAPAKSAVVAEVMNAAYLRGMEDFCIAEALLYFFPATNLFRSLRLFKPGRLVAGDTFLLSRNLTSKDGAWGTMTTKRCSEMIIDYGLRSAQTGSYTLPSTEIAFFAMFNKALSPVLTSLQNPKHFTEPPPLEVALQLYSLDEFDERVTVLNSLTALEALLTIESNAELSYRLSLRVSNLLESDDSSRLNTFRNMRGFYDLRSKIVHGSASKLSPKLQSRLQQVDYLRDIVRRTILSVMALTLAEKPTKDRFDEILDEVVFDQRKREGVQKLAAKFLHLEGLPSSKVN